MMWRTKLSQGLLFANSIYFFTSLNPLQAQIIPDNSLGNDNSIVTPNITIKDALADLIEGGAIRGNNLFHSFSEFNVADGGNVYFANPDGIANILTRVTGNNISEIFGTLGVNGTANLFLLNPNGIIFGENAALDVNGSFLATTADSYIFENGFEYSASNPETPPLLTINIPVGVQLETEPAAIEVQGQGNNLTQEEITLAPIKDNRPVGLEITSGNTLALLGGEINLTGGNLTAAGGNIELGSVEEAATISLNLAEYGFALDYEEINNFGNLNFTQASSIDVSGSGEGNVSLRGKNISVLENSAIIANTLGIDDGGDLTLVASESIEIISDAFDGSFASSLSAFSEGKGDAGNLTIKGKNLVISDGGRIDAGVIDEGNGGDVTIDVGEIEITGISPDESYPSAIYVSSDRTGNSGNLIMKGNRLILKDGGQLDSGVIDTGNGGNVTIDVGEIEITGISPDGSYPSALYVSAEGEGDAGNLVIKGNSLIVKDGGQLDSGVLDTGNGGNVTIDVGEIEITGISPDGSYLSALYVSAEGEGDAGNLSITGDSLTIKDGGQLDLGVTDEGSGGNLTINVKDIEIIGVASDGLYSSALYVSSEGEGDAGNLSITGDSLTIKDGGQINLETLDKGNAGEIDITANTILVTGSYFNGDFTSKITATSKSSSVAGSIDITAERLDITKNAAIVVKNNDLGDAGNLNITANEINLESGGSLNAEVNAGSQGNINLITDNIFLRDQSEINATATGTATGGNISINNTDNIVLLNNSEIIADAIEGNGGNINITTQGLFISPDSLISASSEFGLDGNIEIKQISGDRKFELNKLPEKIADITNLITVTCSGDENNTVAIIGNGGIPSSPYRTQSLNTTWYDLRPVTKEKKEIASLPTPVTEATMTMINTSGELSLVALTPLSTHRWIQSGCQ